MSTIPRCTHSVDGNPSHACLAALTCPVHGHQPERDGNEVTLLVRTNDKPGIDGWALAAGSYCGVHGLGVIIVASPERAAKMVAGREAVTAEQLADIIQCLSMSYARAIAKMTDGHVAVMPMQAVSGALPPTNLPPGPRGQRNDPHRS